jgi:hypothetical protein
LPTYSVLLNVNVPGPGALNVPQTGIVAPSMEAAIALARANIILTTLQAQQTAPTP